LTSVALLRETPVDDLLSLNFPATGDATDVFTLKIAAGEADIDQGSGALLAWSDAGWVDRVTRLIQSAVSAERKRPGRARRET
ncbi:hypothetical protein ACC745_38960, partial [Rhizobium ruizarguesonis]